MGVVDFFVLILITCALAAGVIWVLGYLLGEKVPAIVPKIIWGVAILIIVVALIQALGLMGWNPKSPSLR
jgi:membrane protein DedA with SNARE-associated domain